MASIFSKIIAGELPGHFVWQAAERNLATQHMSYGLHSCGLHSYGRTQSGHTAHELWPT